MRHKGNTGKRMVCMDSLLENDLNKIFAADWTETQWKDYLTDLDNRLNDTNKPLLARVRVNDALILYLRLQK